MSFWDNVKKFAQPYSDEEYDDYEDEEGEEYEEEQEPAPRARRSGGYSAPAEQPAPEYSANEYSAPAYAAPTYSAPAYAAPAPDPRTTGFSGTVLNANLNKQEVVLFHAKAFDDAAKAADELMGKRAVILNMENVDKAMTRRVVDFLSGCVYALGGKVKKVAQSTYLFCPHSMDIVGDLESYQPEATETYM